MTPTFALVTPSFAPDFERCRLLAESVRRHAADHLRHFIVVDRRDHRLFKVLESARTEVVIKQDILPRWLLQLPVSRRWWLSLRSRRPVRGWIVQQVTKLAVPQLSRDDVFIFVDSDTFFVRPYDPRAGLRDGRVPMFREQLPVDDVAHNVAWHRVAAELFGIPSAAHTRANYVAQLVTWRRENVLQLHARIEATAGRPWAEAICGCTTVSEYALYGVFCEQILGESSGHYLDDKIEALCYWSTQKLNEAALRQLRATLQPEHAAVMISAKSHTPVRAIKRAFDL